MKNGGDNKKEFYWCRQSADKRHDSEVLGAFTVNKKRGVSD
jgi:hypothetical protein